MTICTPACQSPATDTLLFADLKQASEGWLISGDLAGWSAMTLRDRRQWMERLFDFLARRELDFSAENLRLFFHGLQKGTDARSRKPMRPARVKHVHSLLSAFCAWCVAEGLLATHLMRRVPAPIMRDDPALPFASEEIDALLRVAAASRAGEGARTPTPFLQAAPVVPVGGLACLRRLDRMTATGRGPGGRAHDCWAIWATERHRCRQ